MVKTKMVAGSNIDTQPCGRTFGGLEGGFPRGNQAPSNSWACSAGGLTAPNQKALLTVRSAVPH